MRVGGVADGARGLLMSGAPRAPSARRFVRPESAPRSFGHGVFEQYHASGIVALDPDIVSAMAYTGKLAKYVFRMFTMPKSTTASTARLPPSD